MSRLRVLLVEESTALADAYARALQGAGLLVDVTRSVPAALQLAAANPPEILVLDTSLPPDASLELLRRLRALEVGTRPILVLISPHGGADYSDAAADAGAEASVRSPCPPGELVSIVLGLIRARGWRTPIYMRPVSGI